MNAILTKSVDQKQWKGIHFGANTLCGMPSTLSKHNEYLENINSMPGKWPEKKSEHAVLG